jgi:hypothetical protein
MSSQDKRDDGEWMNELVMTQHAARRRERDARRREREWMNELEEAQHAASQKELDARRREQEELRKPHSCRSGRTQQAVVPRYALVCRGTCGTRRLRSRLFRKMVAHRAIRSANR